MVQGKKEKRKVIERKKRDSGIAETNSIHLIPDTILKTGCTLKSNSLCRFL
jgi:hypothetical protein